MTTTKFVANINEWILNPIILLLFVLALLLFFWGLAEFILKAGSEDGRTKGKQHMLWGIIGIFVMFAVYGILKVLANTFGFSLPTP
jgi:hypothetical protein